MLHALRCHYVSCNTKDSSDPSGNSLHLCCRHLWSCSLCGDECHRVGAGVLVMYCRTTTRCQPSKSGILLAREVDLNHELAWFQGKGRRCDCKGRCCVFVAGPGSKVECREAGAGAWWWIRSFPTSWLVDGHRAWSLCGWLRPPPQLPVAPASIMSVPFPVHVTTM